MPGQACPGCPAANTLPLCVVSSVPPCSTLHSESTWVSCISQFWLRPTKGVKNEPSNPSPCLVQAVATGLWFTQLSSELFLGTGARAVRVHTQGRGSTPVQEQHHLLSAGCAQLPPSRSRHLASPSVLSRQHPPCPGSVLPSSDSSSRDCLSVCLCLPTRFPQFRLHASAVLCCYLSEAPSDRSVLSCPRLTAGGVWHTQPGGYRVDTLHRQSKPVGCVGTAVGREGKTGRRVKM